MVAFYGAPQDEELGVLGIGSLDSVAAQARAPGAPVLPGSAGRCCPAFELISTVASNAAGDDGNWNDRQTPRTIERYLRAAAGTGRC